MGWRGSGECRETTREKVSAFAVSSDMTLLCPAATGVAGGNAAKLGEDATLIGHTTKREDARAATDS